MRAGRGLLGKSAQRRRNSPQQASPRLGVRALAHYLRCVLGGARQNLAARRVDHGPAGYGHGGHGLVAVGDRADERRGLLVLPEVPLRELHPAAAQSSPQ